MLEEDEIDPNGKFFMKNYNNEMGVKEIKIYSLRKHLVGHQDMRR